MPPTGHLFHLRETKMLMEFCKLLENNPIEAISQYAKIVDMFRESENVTLVEDCAEILSEYLKISSIWKQRAMVETLQKLSFPAKIFVLKHFTDFQTPGLSTDILMTFGPGLKVFQKLSEYATQPHRFLFILGMPMSGIVLGSNNYAKFGIGEQIPEVLDAKQLDFEFDMAFQGKNHTIFWKKFTGEFWAAGKLENFQKILNISEETLGYSSTPIKLDYVKILKEKPKIEMGDDFTVFQNFSKEHSLFIGNHNSQKVYISQYQENITELETKNTENWMKFARKDIEVKEIFVSFHGKQVQVTIELPGCTWYSNSISETGKMVFYFCGKRVSKLPEMTICQDGSVWYRDLETLYKGCLFLSTPSSDIPIQLIASLQEVPLLYRIGGFSVAPDAQSVIIYGKNTNHFEKLFPRHQLDYSMFMNLTFDPWSCYFGDFSETFEKLEKVEIFLKPLYKKCFNEYGFICDELETLTTIDHLYHLISIPEGQKMPKLITALEEYPNDQLAHFLIIQQLIECSKQNETLRIISNNSLNIEQIALEAQKQFEHKFAIIRKGLRIVQCLSLPPDNEGVWTIVKYMEFIGHFWNRHIKSKGKFEVKPKYQAYFQTRDIGRILRRREEEKKDVGVVEGEEDVMREVVKIQAIGHRSDKTCMDYFYMYPCVFYVLKRFVQVMEPRLLNYLNHQNTIDLNLICHNDTDNLNFVKWIRETSGCEHPRDFTDYKKRFFLENLCEDVSQIQTTETLGGPLEIPKFLLQIFITNSESDSKERTLEHFSKTPRNLVKLAMESLFDMRELLEVDTQTKFQIHSFYLEARMFEASADVLKLIVVTGVEEDVSIYRELFRMHPVEMCDLIAKYRPEILFHWGPLPLFSQPVLHLERIFETISRKRYNISKSAQKPLLVWNELPISSPKVNPEWLLEHFSSSSDSDIGQIIEEYLKESTVSLTF